MKTKSLAIVLAWTNFSWQDKPWAEFTTLEVDPCHAMHLVRSIAIWPNLELKTQPKQLLGSLPLDIAIPSVSHLTIYDSMGSTESYLTF